MNINKLNFPIQQELILKSIKFCEFIAFDCEFTGLRLTEEFNQYDSFEDLYQKNKQVCENYTLLQMGITTFRWDSIKCVYIAQPFNISLHKQSSYMKSSVNYQFFQSECMNFLANQTFDFNENFKNGLTYEKIKNKEKCQEQVSSKPQHKFGFFLCEKTENTKTNVFKQIEEFLNTPNKKKIDIDCETAFLARHLMKSGAIEKNFNLEKKLSIGIKKIQPSFLKLQKIKEKKTPSKGNEPSKSNEDKKTPSKTVNEENSKDSEIMENIENNHHNHENENDNNKEKDLKLLFQQEYGFTSIIEAIIDSKKPIIGHYPMLDLLFLYDAFIDELPDNYVDFVKAINQIFPVFFDTKVLAKACHNDIEINNGLEELFYDVFENEKRLKPFHNVILDEDDSFKRYNSRCFHEAGFDALVTGCVFIAINYFRMYLDNAKDIGKIPVLKSKPFKTEFCNTFLNQINCKTLKCYNFNIDKIKENLENNEYFMTNTLYFEIKKAFTLQELGHIFGEWGDVNVNLINKERNKGYVEYMNFLEKDVEKGFLKIISEISAKFNGNIKIALYKDRPRFKSIKLKNF